MTIPFRALCGALAALTAAPVAQNVHLTVDGGSMPGQLTFDLAGGTPFRQSGVLIFSLTAGPTPLALLNPADPRSLCVGLDLLEASMTGPFLANGRFTPPALPVPNLPNLTDAPLFMHAVSIPGSPFIVDQISEPRVVRFAPGGAFRDRLVVLSTPRSFFPVIDLPDGRALFLGGGSGAIFAQVATKTTEIFDPKTDQTSAGPDMTTERSLHTVTRLNDGRYLVVGGVDRLNDPQNSAEIFDPVAMTFTAVGSMLDRRTGHAAALLPDGRVLVSGGIRDMNQTSSQLDPIFSITDRTEIFDPTSNSWTSGPTMARPRAGHSAFAVTRPNGTVRVVHAGGVSFTTIIIINVPTIEASVDLYDPAANAFAAGNAMSQPRAVYSQFPIGAGRVLVAGGVGSLTGTTDRAEIYDAATGAWTSAGTMAASRGLHVAFDLGGGRIAHIGGGAGSLLSPTPLASSDVYDVASGTWSVGPSMTVTRAAFGAYVTPTGQLHVLGGAVGAAGVVTSTEFLYR